MLLLSATRVRDVLQCLERRGIPPPLGNQALRMALSSGDLHEVAPTAMLEDALVEGDIPERSIKKQLLSSMPEGMVATAPIHVEGILSTLEVFKAIIAYAEHQVCIISPYIDAFGVDHLAGVLAEAGVRGVAFRLLSRETDKDSALRLGGIRRLAGLVGKGRLLVKDYYFSEAGRQQTAVHAKLLISDAEFGYVGSAEVRRNALESNFELGYQFHSTQSAETSQRAFETFWERSNSVRVV